MKNNFINFQKLRSNKFLQKSFYLNNQKSFNDKFVSLIMRDGQLLKARNIFNSIFLNFYDFFLNFNSSLGYIYTFYFRFYNFSKSNLMFYTTKFLYNHLSDYLYSMFSFRLVGVAKRFKKKKKKVKYEIVYCYLPY